MATKTVIARVVLNVTFTMDDALNHDRTVMKAVEAAEMVAEAMLCDGCMGLNPDNDEDYDTFGNVAWGEPGVTEIEIVEEN